MTDSDTLLADLKKLLGRLETDLRERSSEVPALSDALRAAYDNARQAERTAQLFETWRDDYLTQAAVAWILACVFVRFIEDNGLIDTPLLGGSGERQQAKDQRTLYFQQHPIDSDRGYLHYVFRTVASLPAAGALFDERHNPLWAFGVSGDGGTALIEFWQRIDPATGALAHDFTDPEWNTRFLGDLYQALSEAARKKYALLQTPEFVEEFILDRTLTPAIDEFGLAEVRLIDPACGSGHFMLGAFHRLLALWQKSEPAGNTRELTQRALDAVYGIDLNPFAVAIARFRLLLAALKASEIHRLVDAPEFGINLAVGDSLLHRPRPGATGARQMYLESDADPLRHVYDTEDAPELRRRQMLWNDHGMLSMGREGEETFGRRHFLDLLSSFTTEPLFSVKHGKLDLGKVHQASFAVKEDHPPVLLLAGKSWAVTHIDWPARVAFVEPTELEGKSRWLGSGQPLRYSLCQAILRVLAGEDSGVALSKRADEQLFKTRTDFTWLTTATTHLVRQSNERLLWWTFAGLYANSAIAQAIREQNVGVGKVDNFVIAFDSGTPAARLESALSGVLALDAAALMTPVSDRAVSELKFSECLPAELARKVLSQRMTDAAAVTATFERSMIHTTLG